MTVPGIRGCFTAAQGRERRAPAFAKDLCPTFAKATAGTARLRSSESFGWQSRAEGTGETGNRYSVWIVVQQMRPCQSSLAANREIKLSLHKHANSITSKRLQVFFL